MRDTDPGNSHLTSRPISSCPGPFGLASHGSVHGSVHGPGELTIVTREALRFPGGVGLAGRLVEPRRRPAPFRSESEAYSYGTAPDVPCCTVTGIDFNSPHSHANGFPAQHTGLPSCFCSGRRFSCMQLNKAIISLLPALSASACPTNMGFAHRAPRTLRPLSFLSQDSTVPRESVGQNTVSGSARVETVLISAVLPNHRPS